MNDSKRTRRLTFEDLYARDADPWSYEMSSYESAKRDKVLSSLEERRFTSAVEIGCSNGVLTAELAPYCENLLAIDIAQSAIDLAEDRLAEFKNIELRRGEIPEDWPGGSFDLIVLSEVLYFLSEEEIAATARLAWQALKPSGLCLLVNWTGPNDLPVDGDGATRIFCGAEPWETKYRSRQESYRIDHLSKSASS